MKSRIYKDLKIRSNYKKSELQKKIVLKLVWTADFQKKLRRRFNMYRINNGALNSRSRIKNRCIFTGRARSVYRNFKCSRLIFRKLANQGLLNSIQKAVY